MQTNKNYPPDPIHKLYVYPIIPLTVIKKFVKLLPNSLHNFFDDNTKDSRFYGLLATFIISFKFSDIFDLIDNPIEEQFIKLLETNSLYAPSKGGMEFLQFTPIFVFHKWLLANLYEGPPIYLRSDYIENVFDEKKMKIICKNKFDHYKDVYNRLNNFSQHFEKQTLEDFVYLTKELFCFPLDVLEK